MQSKIIKINFYILLAYSILSNFNKDGLAVMMIMAFLISIHCGILLIISVYQFYKNDSELAKSYLLTSFIVALVGFATCFGSSSLHSSGSFH